MNESPYGNYGEMNYYHDPEREAGLKYRLDGDDVVQATADELRGMTFTSEGKKLFLTENRLMNEQGVQKAVFFLRGAVNKINHLTKYENEHRINEQIKTQVGGFVRELTKNMKAWAPNGEPKVRSPRLVLRALETKMYQSFLRGNEGFEAQITGKNWGVQEVYDYRKKENTTDRIKSFFGGGE